MDFGTWLGLVFICVCVIVAVWAINKDKYENSEQGRKDREDSERHRLKFDTSSKLFDMVAGGNEDCFIKTDIIHQPENIPAVLYYYARNIIYDKYTDDYIQVVCDKSALEEAIKDFPDWELCYPSKELLEKVSAQIMETELFKEIKENGGLLKRLSTKKERAAYFTSEKRKRPVMTKRVSGGDEFIKLLVNRCHEDGYQEKSKKFKDLSVEERQSLIENHDAEYKDYILKKLWLDYIWTVPENTFLSIDCDMIGLKNDYFNAIYSCLNDVRLRDVMKDDEIRWRKNDLDDFYKYVRKNGRMPRSGYAKKLKAHIYGRLLTRISSSKKDRNTSLDGISLMLFPSISASKQKEVI